MDSEQIHANGRRQMAPALSRSALAPRHILITGASSGIGAALAQAYAGYGVVLSLQGRDKARLESVAAAARLKGATVNTALLDVTNATAMQEWIRACDAETPLELVVANAGISAGTGGGHEADTQVRNVLAVNVNGVLNTVQPAIPLMTARRQGQIAIMSSLASFHGFAGSPAYCASKAAVRVYGEGLRQLLAPEGVSVNVICPGFIQTPMTAVNKFRMPFLMDADKAASIIRRGLEANRSRIAFPWPLYAALMMLTVLPSWIAEPILSRAPRKRGE